MSETCFMELLPETYSVYRYPANAPVPAEPLNGMGLWSFTRTAEEASLVCAGSAPGAAQAETGWRALKVRGPLDFSQVGILAAIAAPLAEAGVSIFALSTFDTDYVLVKEEALEQAVSALEGSGHRVFVGGS